MKTPLPSITAAKEQAKRLREKLEAEGTNVSHSKSLELLAHQYGYRDWNTLHGAIGNRPPVVWSVGDRASGCYLSQPFEAEVIVVESVRPGWFRLTLHLDDAVDVVTFESFSNFRKRVTGIVGPAGTSREKTTNGRLQLELEMSV